MSCVFTVGFRTVKKSNKYTGVPLALLCGYVTSPKDGSLLLIYTLWWPEFLNIVRSCKSYVSPVSISSILLFHQHQIYCSYNRRCNSCTLWFHELNQPCVAVDADTSATNWGCIIFPLASHCGGVWHVCGTLWLDELHQLYISYISLILW